MISSPFGVALATAATLHLAAILGISFEFERPDDSQQPLRSIEVTLVHSRSEERPDTADYLAQTNQRGGGDVREPVRPSSPLPTPRPDPQSGQSSRTLPPQQPQSQPSPPLQRLLSRQNREIESPPPPTVTALELTQPQPDAEQIVFRSREIARLSAEIRQQQQQYAQQPRQRYITANTREYLFATYEDSWRRKVERIGNLNYPKEALQRKLSGTLLLDAVIQADGTLHSIKILRSSGSKILDEGAIHILRLAAPFEPFSPQMRQQIDLLHITRAWQFQDESLQTY
ncbi:energy transducer TonB [Ectothiorhodospiraceae bacterium BW-2]|nr:energy transducer TonB [Ectothiorhodospiraceae bacterium BW-2]